MLFYAFIVEGQVFGEFCSFSTILVCIKMRPAAEIKLVNVRLSSRYDLKNDWISRRFCVAAAAAAAR